MTTQFNIFKTTVSTLLDNPDNKINPNESFSDDDTISIMVIDDAGQSYTLEMKLNCAIHNDTIVNSVCCRFAFGDVEILSFQEPVNKDCRPLTVFYSMRNYINQYKSEQFERGQRYLDKIYHTIRQQ